MTQTLSPLTRLARVREDFPIVDLTDDERAALEELITDAESHETEYPDQSGYSISYYLDADTILIFDSEDTVTIFTEPAE